MTTELLKGVLTKHTQRLHYFESLLIVTINAIVHHENFNLLLDELKHASTLLNQVRELIDGVQPDEDLLDENDLKKLLCILKMQIKMNRSANELKRSVISASQYYLNELRLSECEVIIYQLKNSFKF